MSEWKPEQLKDALRVAMHRRWKEELRRQEERISKPPSTVRPLPRWVWAAAAVVILAVGAWWLLPSPTGPADDLFAEYFTALPNTMAPETRGEANTTTLAEAIRYYEAGEYTQAIRLLDQVPETERPSGFYLYRGIALLAEDRTDEALRDLYIANRDRYRASSQWYRALAALRKGAFPETMDLLEDIIAVPDHPFADQAAALLEDLRQ